MNIFEEWNGAIGDNPEIGDFLEDIEELIEPFQREEVISNIASGLKSVKNYLDSRSCFCWIFSCYAIIS